MIDDSVTTYREIINSDGSITMYQYRDNEGPFISTREFREVIVNDNWIKTGDWSISELKLN